jgi:hypothetical protein
MNVFVGYERSGVVREAFRRRGHQAWSCDLVPADDGSKYHLIGDACWFLENDRSWDLAILHPECTYLCGSGLHWNKRRPERAKLTERAYHEVLWLAGSSGAPRKCIENSVGVLSSRWRKPDQIIQPHQFGHDASKATCLWLENLPLLVPTKAVAPRIIDGKKRWANQTDSGQNRLGPSPTRAIERARTYAGIAEAMAQQWG